MPRTPRAPVPDQDLTETLERLDVATLRPHPRNDGTHPPDEIAHLRQSIREHGIYRNVVVANDGTILAGHGVVVAAQAEGHTHIPGQRRPYGPDDPRALKLLVGDNGIAHLRQRDDDVLVALLQELAATDARALLGTGFDEEALAALLGDLAGDGTGGSEEHGQYSRNIAAPVYTPTGPQPPVEALYMTQRTQELLADIAAADLPEAVKAFLQCAAQRHTIFHYRRIAEYYAHADAATQRLMEQSALVIIDFHRAIELGYVKLSQEIAAHYQEDYDDAG
jgi:ParB-like chromosome segregation protein Spo0J